MGLDYSPLPPGHFRLLRLLPEAKDQHGSDVKKSKRSSADDFCLKWELKTYAVETSPRFAALSYGWGTEPADHPIEINEQTAKIRPNLRDFMQVIQPVDGTNDGIPPQGRSDGGPTDQDEDDDKIEDVVLLPNIEYIWIDALCINQDDMAERGRQVAAMKEVYSAASRLICWLGKAADGSDDAMDFYRKSPLTVEDFHEPSAAQTTALRTLSRRLWFRRSWALQESSTPGPRRELWCGDRRLLLSRCYAVNNTIGDFASARDDTMETKEKAEDNGDTSTTTTTMKSTKEVRMVITNTKIWSTWFSIIGRLSQRRLQPNIVSPFSKKAIFLEILQTYRGHEASDPRDKVYALLPVVRELTAHFPGALPDWLLAPDYDAPVDDLYVKVATYLLGSEDGGPITETLVECLYEPPTDRKLPSWVPNWSVSGALHSPLTDAEPIASDTVVVQEGGKAILLKGCIFGHICDLGPQPPVVFASDSASARHVGAVARYIFPDQEDVTLHSGQLLSETIHHLLWRPRDGSQPALNLLGVSRSGDVQVEHVTQFEFFCKSQHFKTSKGHVGYVGCWTKRLGPGISPVERGDVLFAVPGLGRFLLIRPVDDGWGIVGNTVLLGIGGDDVISEAGDLDVVTIL